MGKAKKYDAVYYQSFINQLENYQFLKLFDSVPNVLFWIKNKTGKYMMANIEVLKIYLLSNESDIVGKTDFDLAPAYLAEQWVRDDQHVLEGNEIHNRIELVGEFNQKITWHITNKIPLFSKKGLVVGTAGTSRVIQRNSPENRGLMEFEPVVNYISENFKSAIQNEYLAELVFLSKSAFERKFKKLFKHSVQNYIKKIRINAACKKLLESDDSIIKIANDCGFCDQSYMTKEFKINIGKTPHDVRKDQYQ